MSEQIRITMPEVSLTAQNMRSLNANLDEILNSISNQMRELSSVWQSTGADTIAANFQRFAGRFVMESQTIEEYCKFLDLTVATYDSLENTITGNANSFN